MTWTTPKTWTVGSPGTSADLNTYVRDNTNFLNQTLRAVNTAANWSNGYSLQFGSQTFTPAAGGTVITYPLSYSSFSLPVCQAGDNAGFVTSILARTPTVTGFTAWAYNGATQLTSGTCRINWITVGI